MLYTEEVERILALSADRARTLRHEFVTPVHVLLLACQSSRAFCVALSDCGVNVDEFRAKVSSAVGDLERVPGDDRYDLYHSDQLEEALVTAQSVAKAAGSREVNIAHLVSAICSLEESVAADLIYNAVGGNMAALLASLVAGLVKEHLDSYAGPFMPEDDEDDELDFEDTLPFGRFLEDFKPDLYGRKNEIDSVMRTLCKKDYNNVLLVGEHGVGKTALIQKVAHMIQSKSSLAPKRLHGKRFFLVNTSQLMNGTEMRGALERNVSILIQRLEYEKDIIAVIEDFHLLFQTGNNSVSREDPLAILGPSLKSSQIPFILTTTFAGLKRIETKDSMAGSILERINLEEISRNDTLKVLKQFESEYSSFHGVSPIDSCLEQIVDLSIRHMEGCLPAKAIALMDNIGAYLESHPKMSRFISSDDATNITAILTGKKIGLDTNDPLDGLAERIKTHIFGQDKAVDAVCSSLLISKAGLSNPQKPLGSFLFIGPTGVGKTQLAKTLSSELGEPLVRFDMSEYAEKHTVSKFIGSPAGYVGYDDGGLLTDAVRKNPGCVLLLDEIEKAHQDIYNLLLQIMDYGTLTDSKGQKADFRGVVLIMTSNAGARFASQPSIGYSKTPQPGIVMESEAKKVFAPEFLNRLTSTVVFSSLDKQMAMMVLDSKIADLSLLLKERKVRFSVSKAAKEKLLEDGFSPEYGARQIERLIENSIKPLLVDAILFGNLKSGGKAVVDYVSGKYTLR